MIVTWPQSGRNRPTSGRVQHISTKGATQADASGQAGRHERCLARVVRTSVEGWPRHERLQRCFCRSTYCVTELALRPLQLPPCERSDLKRMGRRGERSTSQWTVGRGRLHTAGVQWGAVTCIGAANRNSCGQRRTAGSKCSVRLRPGCERRSSLSFFIALFDVGTCAFASGRSGSTALRTTAWAAAKSCPDTRSNGPTGGSTIWGASQVQCLPPPATLPGSTQGTWSVTQGSPSLCLRGSERCTGRLQASRADPRRRGHLIPVVCGGGGGVSVSALGFRFSAVWRSHSRTLVRQR